MTAPRLSSATTTESNSEQNDPNPRRPTARAAKAAQSAMSNPFEDQESDDRSGGNFPFQRPLRPHHISKYASTPDEKSDVFISARFTEQFIGNQFISEHFPTAQQLYQYLHWTLRINKLVQTPIVIEGQNAIKVLLFDVELHDHRGQSLYALCTPNDLNPRKSHQWQLVHLLTANELTSWLGIDSQSLPRGVRAVSPQFQGYRQLMTLPKTGSELMTLPKTKALKVLKSQIQEMDLKRKPIRFTQLKSIQTGCGRRKRRKRQMQPEGEVVFVALSVFYASVCRALNDDDVDLVPILSIITRSKRVKDRDFSVDYLLPVQVGGHCVGVVYRDMEPVMVLMDKYDITNKAMICDPSFDPQTLCRFRICRDRLRVVPDHQYSEYGTESTTSTTESVDDGSLCSETVSRTVLNPMDGANPAMPRLAEWNSFSSQSSGLNSTVTSPSVTPAVRPCSVGIPPPMTLGMTYPKFEERNAVHFRLNNEVNIAYLNAMRDKTYFDAVYHRMIGFRFGKSGGFQNLKV